MGVYRGWGISCVDTSAGVNFAAGIFVVTEKAVGSVVLCMAWWTQDCRVNVAKGQKESSLRCLQVPNQMLHLTLQSSVSVQDVFRRTGAKHEAHGNEHVHVNVQKCTA